LIATKCGDQIKIAAIDGWVSQIRNLLTMVRKAIHLDGREKRASIDPSRAITARRATTTKLSRASHVVSGPRLLKERERKRERDRPPGHSCRDCIRDDAIIYITSELVNKRHDVGRGSVSQPPLSAEALPLAIAPPRPHRRKIFSRVRAMRTVPRTSP